MGQNKLVSKKVKVSQTINDRTGEILESSSSTIAFTQEPEFVKLYFQDMLLLHSLSSTGNRAINVLISKMNYDNEIVLTSGIKNELAKKLSIAKNTLEHAISELVKKGILLKKGNNWYLVNPKLYARGKWQDIQKLQMTLTYSENGRIIDVSSSTQKELPFKH